MKAAEPATRISFKNILYATDFSPVSEAALPFVFDFAKQFGAKVHALHVRMPSPGWFIGADALSQLIVTESELAERDRLRLDEMLARLPHTATVAEGDLWEPLSRLIDNENIDLVIIGTHGRTGARKAVLGSIAAELFRSVTCPVLTVGPRSLPAARVKSELKHILYAADFSPAALAAAPYAVSLTQEFEARLTILTVLDEPSPGDLVTPEVLVESTKRRQHELIPPQVQLSCRPEYVVATGKVAEEILGAAEGGDTNLIVLGVKDAGGLLTTATHLAHATAQRVAAMGPCPVLTIKAQH